MDRAAVVGREQEEADRLGAMTSQQFREGLGSSRLRDLAGGLRRGVGRRVEGFAATRSAADLAGGRPRLHEPVVHPERRHRAPVERFALRELVLVMRKDQVEPATVDVEVLAENRLAHRRALDVPPRPTRPPRARPRRFPRLGRLPEREVGRRSLPLRRRATLALHLVHGAIGQFAVVGVLRDVEVDVAVAGVREALGDEPLDEGDDRVDVLRRLRHHVDAVDAECREVAEIVGRHLLCQGAHRRLTGHAFRDDLVVDVRDVDHPGDGPPGEDEVPLDRVEDHRPHHVADVARLVDGRPAEIHADVAGPHRHEWCLRSCQRAVDLDPRPAGRRRVDRPGHRHLVRTPGNPRVRPGAHGVPADPLTRPDPTARRAPRTRRRSPPPHRRAPRPLPSSP